MFEVGRIAEEEKKLDLASTTSDLEGKVVLELFLYFGKSPSGDFLLTSLRSRKGFDSEQVRHTDSELT